MAEIIAIASGKGGVGKSTSTANLGTALAMMGKKILMIDGDIGLRNLDLILGMQNSVAYDFNDILNDRCSSEQAILADEKYPGLHLLPAPQNIDINEIDKDKLNDLIAKLNPYYDFILIDCPAGIHDGFMLMSSKAKKALIVTTPELMSVRDADMTVSKLEGLHFDEIYLIINKISVEMVKSGEMMSIDDIINIVAVPLIGAIPDEKSIIHSNNIGKPIVLKTRSRAGMAYANIAKRLTGVKVPILQDEKKCFFRFLRKR
ncbi:MAG: septum site-determining protein MinD [Clostridia bacterium]|nr:septum site-determining protein MinD [Clostridia bacterium]